MLQIRRDQYEQWFQRNPEHFTELLLQRVRKRHPTWRQTDNMLRDSIRTGIHRAMRNGLVSDRQVSEFVLIMFEVAPNFDRQKDIRRALDDKSLSIEERWESLFTPKFDEAWAEADRPEFYDASAWFDHPVPDPSPAIFPSYREWAEIVACANIARRSPPGSTPSEPTPADLQSAAEQIRLQYLRRNRIGDPP